MRERNPWNHYTLAILENIRKLNQIQFSISIFNIKLSDILVWAGDGVEGVYVSTNSGEIWFWLL